ncbi:MAG TPA: phenylalanine--tRNA ligase subunit alpha [Bacteroidota bacterium]|jgi:phenylalanyl-tRNA synthetase alpha chain
MDHPIPQDLREQIDRVQRDALLEIGSAENLPALESLRIKYLSRKGIVAHHFELLGGAPPELRPGLGKRLNEMRSSVQAVFQEKELSLGAHKGPPRKAPDLTLPGRKRWIGSTHPLSQTLDEIKRIFFGMGFGVAVGPEIEDDYHNFEALNFPPDHPARDMQDTFFISGKYLMRTHTSPAQIRVMEKQKPPVRIIVPGRVYRNEAISSRSYCLFHQVEGLYVDRGVTFSDLKGTLVSFARQFYGSTTRYRFRPSYFPFTEPSAEMDISCVLCAGKGCKVCKFTGWLEILGCGMVDPNVYGFVGYDPEIYTGYAFGIGVDRMTMLRYGIDDIRLLFENDVRFLNQFR